MMTEEEIAQLDYEWARYGVTVADLREWNKKYPHGQ